MRGLAGKRVLISGGSSGIGLAAARRFLEEGCRVFVAGLDAAEVSRAVAGLRDLGDVAGTGCDVSREADVADLTEAAWRALGGVDVLINNAGTAARQPFLQITPAQWDRILAVNLRGMFLVARAVAARHDRAGPGRSHRQHVLDQRDRGRGGLRPLQRVQGRRAAADQDHGGGTGQAWHPGERAVPRVHQHPAERGHHGPAWRPGSRPDTPAADPASAGPAGPRRWPPAYAFLASDDASFIHGTGLVIDGGQLAVM